MFNQGGVCWLYTVFMAIAIFKKANNKRKRQTNAGNPTAKQNRVPYEPRQGAGLDLRPPKSLCKRQKRPV